MGFDGVMSESSSLNSHSNTVFNLGERSLLPPTAVPSPWGMPEEESRKSGHVHTSLGCSEADISLSLSGMDS